MVFTAYSTSLIVLACLLVTLGIYLIAGKIPQRLESSGYKMSRRYMGVAYLVLALSIFVFFVTKMGDMPHRYKIALNISSYYISAKFFALSFFSLVEYKLDFNNPRVRGMLILVASFPVFVWLTALIKDVQLGYLTQIIVGLLLFGSIMIDIVRFFNEYNKNVHDGMYRTVDGVYVYLGWVAKSLYLIAGVGVFSAGAALFSSHIHKLILFLYLLYFCGVCIYIFSRLLHFMVVVSELDLDDKDDDDEVDMSKVRISPEAYQNIHKQMLDWVERKDYCKKRVTILTVAAIASTNRLYLSNYINVTYKCSFRVWVSKMRIEEAKRIMFENRNVTITSVADQVGFQSLASFTHAFKNLEGCAPKDWVKGIR